MQPGLTGAAGATGKTERQMKLNHENPREPSAGKRR